MNYFRPQTLDEALSRLAEGVPLAGGTAITPRRRGMHSVVDLQDIGLDALEVAGDTVRAGAMVRLQAIVDAPAQAAPPALHAACRLEAAANMRRMATLGGAVFAADGRSPLVCALLALGVEAQVVPGEKTLALDALLDQRASWPKGSLVAALRWPAASALGFQSVGRSPADRPVVCAAFGRNRNGWRLVVGGWGSRPILVAAGQGPVSETEIEAAIGRVRTLCAAADDDWASGAYRAEAGAVLARRVAREGMAG
jgi:CO/xanthine dehydrogenase FAD-binding subunit